MLLVQWYQVKRILNLQKWKVKLTFAKKDSLSGIFKTSSTILLIKILDLQLKIYYSANIHFSTYYFLQYILECVRNINPQKKMKKIRSFFSTLYLFIKIPNLFIKINWSNFSVYFISKFGINRILDRMFDIFLINTFLVIKKLRRSLFLTRLFSKIYFSEILYIILK